MQSSTTRTPTEDDLPEILELTRANRALLAELEPRFWGQSANADEVHRMFVTYQIENQSLIKRVLERDGRVVGYAVSVDHPSGFYFIDDVCLAADMDWATDGAALLNAIEERPALMTAPHRDSARIDAAIDVGLERIGSVRLVLLDQDPPFKLDPHPVEPMQTPVSLAEPPVHVWQPAMTPDSVTVIGDDQGGYAVMSPPIAPPPIYDPGGSAAVVDRVLGDARERLLMKTLSYASQCGDTGLILVVEGHDTELSEIADRLGSRHPVDVFRWP